MAGGSAGSSGFCQERQTAVAYVAHMVKTLKWNRLPNTFVSSRLFSNKRRRVADVKIFETDVRAFAFERENPQSSGLQWVCAELGLQRPAAPNELLRQMSKNFISQCQLTRAETCM